MSEKYYVKATSSKKEYKYYSGNYCCNSEEELKELLSRLLDQGITMEEMKIIKGQKLYIQSIIPLKLIEI